MAAKFTRLTHKIVIQLHLVTESCTIWSSHSRRPVRKLLDTPSYHGSKLILVCVHFERKAHQKNTYSFLILHKVEFCFEFSASSTRTLTRIKQFLCGNVCFREHILEYDFPDDLTRHAAEKGSWRLTSL